MNSLKADLELAPESGEILDRSASAWEAVLLVSFNEPTKTVTNPLSVTTVKLETSEGTWAGYDSTPPLRKLEGEITFEIGSALKMRIDLLHEFSKHDAEDLRAFPAGKAQLLVEGVVWIRPGPPVEFRILKKVVVV
jgi:hypothetical protein